MSDGADGAEWLRLLLAELCCAGRLFGALYTALDGASDAAAERPTAGLVVRAERGMLLRSMAEAVDLGCDMPAMRCMGDSEPQVSMVSCLAAARRGRNFMHTAP